MKFILIVVWSVKFGGAGVPTSSQVQMQEFNTEVACMNAAKSLNDVKGSGFVAWCTPKGAVGGRAA